MSGNVNVRLADAHGQAMTSESLLSLYAADLRFEPEWRFSTVLSDGSVDLLTPDFPFCLNAKIDVPDFGRIWVCADNEGRGYRAAGAIDFVPEAAASHLKHALDVRAREDESCFSVSCLAHFDAAAEYLALARKGGARADAFALRALYHALYAGEYAIVEHSRRQARMRPLRKDFLFGSKTQNFLGMESRNFTKPRIPDGALFSQVFNYASVPFYLNRLEHEKGRPDYSFQDQLVEWAQTYALKLKGHPLWWESISGQPEWLRNISFEERLRECDRVVTRSASRYKGKIDWFDVINEPHDWGNTNYLNREQWVRLIRRCCDSAHDANPNLTAVVNNAAPFAGYVVEPTNARHFFEPSDAIRPATAPDYTKIKRMSPLKLMELVEEAGIRYDVVGVQLYFPERDMLTISRLLDEFAKFGKPIQLSELGVRASNDLSSYFVTHPGEDILLPRRMKDSLQSSAEAYTHSGYEKVVERDTPVGWHYAWCEKVQADWMEGFFTLCYAKEAVNAVAWWDFNDPGYIPNSGITDESGRVREIFYRLKSFQKNLKGENLLIRGAK